MLLHTEECMCYCTLKSLCVIVQYSVCYCTLKSATRTVGVFCKLSCRAAECEEGPPVLQGTQDHLAVQTVRLPDCTLHAVLAGSTGVCVW